MEFSDSAQEMLNGDDVFASPQSSGSYTPESGEDGPTTAEQLEAVAAEVYKEMAAKEQGGLAEERNEHLTPEDYHALALEGYYAITAERLKSIPEEKRKFMEEYGVKNLGMKDVAGFASNRKSSTVEGERRENLSSEGCTADNRSEAGGGSQRDEGSRNSGERKDFTFQFDDDVGYLDYFQADLENELDDIAEESINAEPRYKYADDENKSFEEIAATMKNLDENGYVKKKIISEGSGETPPLFARALVHYDFYKEGFEEPFDSTYLRSKPCKIRLDEGEIIPGLEIALKSMKKKESAKFMFKWEVAFGIQGCPPRIPKRCTVLAYVELVDFSPLIDKNNDLQFNDGQYSLNTFARGYKDAKATHIEGNEEFAVRNIKGAIRCYRRCIAILNELKLENVGEEKRMLCLKIKCLVNLSICYNKLNKPEQACIVARQALTLDDKNTKALYQYGKANLVLSNLDLAEKWLKKAYNLKPDDVDILRELGKLNERKDRAKALDNLFCKRAFQFYQDEEDGKKGNGVENDKGEENTKGEENDKGERSDNAEIDAQESRKQ